MRIKDLFGVLLPSQYVALYNASGIHEWEGEFKRIPRRYFDCITNNMYLSPTITKDSFIVINFKRIIQEDRREDM